MPLDVLGAHTGDQLFWSPNHVDWIVSVLCSGFSSVSHGAQSKIQRSYQGKYNPACCTSFTSQPFNFYHCFLAPRALPPQGPLHLLFSLSGIPSLAIPFQIAFLKTLYSHVCVVTQSCLTLCDPMDCSPPGSSMGIIQARILEWVAISSSKGSSPSRDQSRVSYTAGFAV